MQMTRDENHELAIHFWADGTQPDPLHGSMETLSERRSETTSTVL